MEKRGLRLGVELNSVIKFYIKTTYDARVKDLKKSIDSMLSKYYNITLPEYRMRSESGFEVLCEYAVGDVLNDNEVILLDMFSLGLLSSPAAPQADVKPLIKNAEVSFKLKRPSRPKTEKAGVPARTEKVPVAVKIETPAVPAKTETSSAPPRVIALDSQAIAVKAVVEEVKTIKDTQVVAPLEITPTPAPVDLGRATAVEDTSRTLKSNPEPNSFKGFDITRPEKRDAEEAKVNESSFRPLKKKKDDFEMLELEI